MNYDDARMFTCLQNGYRIFVYPRNPEITPTMSGFYHICVNTFKSLKDSGFVTKSAEKHPTRNIDLYVSTKKGRTAYAEYLKLHPLFLEHLRALAEHWMQHARASGRRSGARETHEPDECGMCGKLHEGKCGQATSPGVKDRVRHVGSVDAQTVRGSVRAVRQA